VDFIRTVDTTQEVVVEDTKEAEEAIILRTVVETMALVQKCQEKVMYVDDVKRKAILFTTAQKTTIRTTIPATRREFL
jgi:hypothetical protein